MATIGFMGFAEIAARSLDLIFPPTCAACGMPGDGVCAGCRASLTSPSQVGCARCGYPWEVATSRCHECPAAVDVTRQAVTFDSVAQAVVSALKDDHRRAIAREIAVIISERIPRPPRGTPLVPVPLSASREEERGFNQAELIAWEVGARWDLPVVDILVRDRDGPAQRGASATERRLNVRGAFRIRDDAARVPWAVCLVDDVVTTGSTVSSCARALRRGGVSAVGAVAFARVVRAPALR